MNVLPELLDLGTETSQTKSNVNIDVVEEGKDITLVHLNKEYKLNTTLFFVKYYNIDFKNSFMYMFGNHIVYFDVKNEYKEGELVIVKRSPSKYNDDLIFSYGYVVKSGVDEHTKNTMIHVIVHANDVGFYENNTIKENLTYHAYNKFIPSFDNSIGQIIKTNKN